MERITTEAIHRLVTLLCIANTAIAMRCLVSELGIRILSTNNRRGIVTLRLHIAYAIVHDVLMVMMILRLMRRDILVNMQVRLCRRRYRRKAEIDGLIVKFIVEPGVNISDGIRCHHFGMVVRVVVSSSEIMNYKVSSSLHCRTVAWRCRFLLVLQISPPGSIPNRLSCLWLSETQPVASGDTQLC